MRLLVSDNLSLHNEVAHLRERMAGCVSREVYESKCDECEMKEALLKDARECEEKLNSEKAVLCDKISQLEARIKDLEQENARLKKKEFAPSSEILEGINKDLKLPDNKMDMLVYLAGLKQEAEKTLGKSREEAGKEDADKHPRGKDKKKRKPRSASPRKMGVYTKDVAKALGIDTSNLPANAKILMRGDGPDIWKFRVMYAQRIRIYSKEYTIGRFYIPGEKDLVNSRYPAGIYEKCKLSPSFVALYLRLKISYNVSEQNILRALMATGCEIPQATLNKSIQRVEKTIREFLEEAMIEEIRASRFTHNDETRLRVKCPDKKTGLVSYHTEYVHGLLSPSARLLLLIYDEGSRVHQVQEQIMEGSSIECFVCDKAKMYPKIVKDLGNLIRAGCWVHWRRDLLALTEYDKRFLPILRALQILFGLEEKWRNEGLDEHKRLEKRQEVSRPVVDCIFSMLRSIKANAHEYSKDALTVVDYVLNDEDAFKAFLTHGLIEMDNNAIERCFRHIAMGRRTWLFAGSHAGAENLAFMYSLEESCKMNGLDFGDYIEYVLERIAAGEKAARSILPNRIQIPSDWVPEGQIDCPTQVKTA